MGSTDTGTVLPEPAQDALQEGVHDSGQEAVPQEGRAEIQQAAEALDTAGKERARLATSAKARQKTAPLREELSDTPDSGSDKGAKNPEETGDTAEPPVKPSDSGETGGKDTAASDTGGDTGTDTGVDTGVDRNKDKDEGFLVRIKMWGVGIARAFLATYEKNKMEGHPIKGFFYGLWDSIKALGSGEEETPENKDPDYKLDISDVDIPNDPESQKLVTTALLQLKGVESNNKTWIGLAGEAAKRFELGPKGQATILAMARFESRFNPEIKADSSSATGLGQFLKGTWKDFQKANSPEFADAERTDPRASIFAIAWYASSNAKTCGIDLNGPRAAAQLYEVHHEGSEGYKRLTKFREYKDDAGLTIPKSYKDKKFPKFGVSEVKTYADYEKLVTAMSDRVQLVADAYDSALNSSEVSTQ